jgi:hypothetical protein
MDDTMSPTLLAHSQRAIELAEASGISCKPAASKFVDKILSCLQADLGHTDVARQLSSALERVLDRNHEDSRLILTLCFTLQEWSRLEASEFQKKLARAIRYLEKPAASAVVKTMKQAAVVGVHRCILDIQDLDTIAALSQVPQELIKPISEDSGLLQIGSETIHLASTNKKEIQSAIKKVKDETKRVRDNSTDEHGLQLIPTNLKESLGEVGLEIRAGEADFSNELDEAALALTNLLRSLPREGALSNLAAVIEEAKTLLELTKQSLLFPGRTPHADITSADQHN